MKQKNIADAYDHLKIKDTHYKGNKATSNNDKHSTGTKLDIKDYPPPARNYKNTHIPSSQYRHPSENIRQYSHRKPYTYPTYHYLDRDYKTRKFNDNRPVKSNEFHYKDYRRISENKRVQPDWIDDMCWFHYTKGQSATNCVDPEKCHGYKTFHRKC